MKLSVIMPVWIPQDEGYMLTSTSNAIDSLGEVDELLIVDNGSSTGGGWLRQKANTLIRYPQNKGFTPAINDGFLVSDGDLIAYVNNDIVAAPNWGNVCEEILRDESIATVHPMMLDATEPFRYGNEVYKTGKERWCQGSFVVTTRRFLNDMRNKEWGKEPYPGLFDENFGIGGGGDDWDWAVRIRNLGYFTAYTNKTCFQHHHSMSLKKLSNRKEIAKQNDEYFTKKHGIKKEELFLKLYPDQMNKDWKGGFV